MCVKPPCKRARKQTQSIFFCEWRKEMCLYALRIYHLIVAILLVRKTILKRLINNFRIVFESDACKEREKCCLAMNGNGVNMPCCLCVAINHKFNLLIYSCSSRNLL